MLITLSRRTAICQSVVEVLIDPWVIFNAHGLITTNVFRKIVRSLCVFVCLLPHYCISHVSGFNLEYGPPGIEKILSY